MNTLRLQLCGYGRVGRAFVELLQAKRPALAGFYGLTLLLTALVDVDGAAVALGDEGLPLERVLRELPRGTGPSALTGYGQPGVTLPQILGQNVADVLVETTPTNIQDGEPAMAHITAALEHRLHVVTAVKGPLVLAGARLRQLAAERGVALKYSAAAAAALPALDVGLYCLAGTHILKIEGILNGTTNYILSRMQAEGSTYQAALAEAQRLGIAETDPRLDVEGWDAASKLVLLANALLTAGLQLADVEVAGITQVTQEAVAMAALRGGSLKLIAQAERKGSAVRASVGVQALSPDHPLAHIMGAEKAITYTTDTMDRVTVSGGKSDPRGAAAAMLKDLINLAREGQPG